MLSTAPEALPPPCASVRGNKSKRRVRPVRAGRPADWGRKPRACASEYGTVAENDANNPNAAQDAVADLQHGLDSAKRLVERTRFLLAGDAAQEGDALALDPGAAQAAAAPASETVQNPSGE
jgi:hypothetical protein